MASDKIKVAVRVRPFNRRELELGTQCVVDMEEQQTVLQYPQAHDKDRDPAELLTLLLEEESFPQEPIPPASYVSFNPDY